MKIAVLFGSHEMGGKHEEIRQMLLSLNLPYAFEFIELSDISITPCLQSCAGCVIKTENKCLYDEFDGVLKKLSAADINLIVVPVYYPYPSKFVALMEKLLKVSYRTENRPLKDKNTAVFLYCSCKICDETQLKGLWRQFLMDGGYFAPPTPHYPFLNTEDWQTANQKYDKNITEYIRDFVLHALPRRILSETISQTS